jgi:DNA-binding beta-propeller fold protein YncE
MPLQVGAAVLYVGSTWPILSEYRLGSSKPFRSVKTTVGVDALASDSLGNLYVAEGGIDDGGVFVYDAAGLKLLREMGLEASTSLTVDRNNYLYDANCSAVAIYPPNINKSVQTLHRGAQCNVLLDSSENLYVATYDAVNVFAAKKNPGHVKYVRRLHSEAGSVKALALDSADDLIVADCVTCYYSSPPRSDYVEEYASGSYGHLLTITRGIDAPVALAVDSKGLLYVANDPGFASSGSSRGWISVYAPGKTQPLRKITDGIDRAVALAIDPSDNLYVANEGGNSVTAYARGATKLMLKITAGLKYPTALFIRSR